MHGYCSNWNTIIPRISQTMAGKKPRKHRQHNVRKGVPGESTEQQQAYFLPQRVHLILADLKTALAASAA